MNGNELLFGFTRKFLLSVLLIFVGLWFFIKCVGNVILVPFGFSAITAYIFYTVVNRLSTRFAISRSLISMLIVVCIFTTLIVFAIVFIPVAIRNISLIKQYLPQIAASINGFMLKYLPHNVYDNIVAGYSGMDFIINRVTTITMYQFQNIASIFVQTISFFLITPVIMYYMVKDWGKINESITSLVPEKHRQNFINIRMEIRQKLAGYLAGQFTIIIFLSVFYGVLLWLSGVNFGFTIGTLTGLASIVPYVGITIGVIVGVVMALQSHSLFLVCVVCVIFICGQVIEGGFLTPRLMSSKINIHPLWVIFGFLTFGILFGFFGILFALPLTAIASVLIKFYVQNFYKKYYS